MKQIASQDALLHFRSWPGTSPTRAPRGRIPNFAGAEVAAARLLDIEPWKGATAIKVNRDSPQRPLRAEALRRGITVFIPTPRLCGGFKQLDPRRIPPDKIEAALKSRVSPSQR